MRKNVYLVLAIIGAVVPYYFLFQFLGQNGLDLGLFVQQATATPAATMFAVDLVISSVVFWVYLFTEGPKRQMSHLWLYVVVNLLIGLSMALPLFLYMRERALEGVRSAPAVD